MRCTTVLVKELRPDVVHSFTNERMPALAHYFYDDGILDGVQRLADHGVLNMINYTDISNMIDHVWYIT